MSSSAILEESRAQSQTQSRQVPLVSSGCQTTIPPGGLKSTGLCLGFGGWRDGASLSAWQVPDCGRPPPHCVLTSPSSSSQKAPVPGIGTARSWPQGTLITSKRPVLYSHKGRLLHVVFGGRIQWGAHFAFPSPEQLVPLHRVL